MAEGRAAYLYVIDGSVAVSGLSQQPGSTAGGAAGGADGSAAGSAEQLATGDALVMVGSEAATISGTLPTSELWMADVPLSFTPHGIWAAHAH